MRPPRSLPVLLVLLATATFPGRWCRAQTAYQKPPRPVLDVLHAPLPPAAVVSPTHDRLILAAPVRYPPIADLAEPMLRLAGVRFLLVNRGHHAAPRPEGEPLQPGRRGRQSGLHSG